VQKPTEKYEYPQKYIFLTVYSQKITHRNRITEKSKFSVSSPSEIIFLSGFHSQKNYTRPDEKQFFCTDIPQKKEINTQRNTLTHIGKKPTAQENMYFFVDLFELTEKFI
jgi:hypothetical protein